MAVSTDILRAYRRPRVVFRELLERGISDRMGLVFLVLAMGLGFVSHLPSISRRAATPDPELEAAIRAETGDVRPIEGVEVPAEMVDAKYQLFLAQELMAWFFILPLMFYALAALGGWIARRFGGRIGGVEARLALFWALLVAVPLKLVHGIVYGTIGDGPVLLLAGLPWVVVLVWNWVSNLAEAGRAGAS